MRAIDPDLLGRWGLPGEPYIYEVLPDGSYHVADAAAPLSFSDDAAEMTWDDQVFDRQGAAGIGVEGAWRARDSAESWMFTADGSYQVGWGDARPPATGIWALHDHGRRLWTREKLAQLTTDGANVVFHLIDGGPQSYGYTVSDGIWTLLDPTSWKKRAAYHRL
ncbi:hypothetical protein [Rhodophyticola porphyridii]|nr:hypothetical protein [Rhodophyticola porphyridii]